MLLSTAKVHIHYRIANATITAVNYHIVHVERPLRKTLLVKPSCTPLFVKTKLFPRYSGQHILFTPKNPSQSITTISAKHFPDAYCPRVNRTVASTLNIFHSAPVRKREEKGRERKKGIKKKRKERKLKKTISIHCRFRWGSLSHGYTNNEPRLLSLY